MDHQQRYDAYTGKVDEALSRFLTQSGPSAALLFDAMRYSVFGGGKRIRPVLLLEFCRVSGGDPDMALPFACALEMIHTYSLIHDDLPCMDNDDMRRGRATNHKVYSEHTAVLAGDALLNLAFEIMLDPLNMSGYSAQTILAAAHTIARASGVYGMTGGQCLDMDRVSGQTPAQMVAQIHALKTGALIDAAAQAGCILACPDEKKREAANAYACNIGLAFQIKDDLLDLEGDPGKLGKPTGSDAAGNKLTFPSVYGVQHCGKLISNLTERAIEALGEFADPAFLTWLAQKLALRDR